MPNKIKRIAIPLRYLPTGLTRKDQRKQRRMLLNSRKQYKENIYVKRTRVKSFKSKTSNHIVDAQRIYGITNVKPSEELATKTGCSLASLKQIVKKGEGAYYSSGSRPNQTAQSWGLARLASSITSGKAAAVDYNIIDKGCKHDKKAYLLANKSRKKYKFGHSATRKTSI
jgi:hypothetical protein